MKDNYEKILLGGAAVAAVALGVFGFLKMKSVDEVFVGADENQRDAEPILAEHLVDKASAGLTKPAQLTSVKVSGDREVESFTGVDLFIRKGEDKPIDLLAPEEKPVHPPIPNLWWITNNIDPGFGDSPQRDHDEDGFSNIEEFDAGTNAADSNSFPSLFAKIKVVGVEKEQWYLRFTNQGNEAVTFRIEGVIGGKVVKNKGSAGSALSPGSTFFSEGAFQNRFKYVAIGKKEVRGIQKDFVSIEDLKPGKVGKTYEIPSGAHKTFQTDYKATLFLDTPAESGNKFLVEEGTSFSLPYDPEATDKPYTLAEIQNDGASLLLLWEKDGETKQLELSVPQ